MKTSRFPVPSLATRLAVACCLALIPISQTVRAAAKPNVLFIAIDDLNDWIGALGGHPQAQTPNLDQLAKRGVLFTRAYCAAPACNPSRAALMTGIRPSTSGVYHNDQPWRPAMPDKVTLAQHFMANDYVVQGGGKIFHNSYNDRASWQFYQKTGPFAEPKQRSMPKSTSHFDWGAVDCDDDQMGDTQVVDWAVNFLRQKQAKPFFLAAGMIRPHLPFYAPKKYFDQFPLAQIKLPEVIKDDLADVPPAGVRIARPDGDHKKVVEAGEWAHAVQSYLACIAYTDGQIGRLITALDTSPHAKNTIVVLWSDHGWHLGEKEHWRKFALWEEATRLTFMVVAPGVTKPDQQCGRTVNLLDIYPTLVELCGLSKMAGLEGDSLVPLLKNANAKWDRPSTTTHGKDNHAVRSEQWRYIRYADGSEELYDHAADPNEWKNLATDPKHFKVKAELAAWMPKVNVPDAPREKKAPAGDVNDRPKQKKAKKKA